MHAETKARDPKAVMKIETLNATFQPAKIGNPCGLQITYLKDNSTRNIFVYHSDAKVHGTWLHHQEGMTEGAMAVPIGLRLYYRMCAYMLV